LGRLLEEEEVTIVEIVVKRVLVVVLVDEDEGEGLLEEGLNDELGRTDFELEGTTTASATAKRAAKRVKRILKGETGLITCKRV
jgi:hypothetical protein